MCQLYLNQVRDLEHCEIICQLQKTTYCKISLMHLTETFPVKLLQIVVSDANPKRVLAHIL